MGKDLIWLPKEYMANCWLQTFSVQPHRHKSFKLSTDPFFVEKLRNIVGQYLNPPDQQCQATDQSQP